MKMGASMFVARTSAAITPSASYAFAATSQTPTAAPETTGLFASSHLRRLWSSNFVFVCFLEEGTEKKKEKKERKKKTLRVRCERASVNV